MVRRQQTEGDLGVRPTQPLQNVGDTFRAGALQLPPPDTSVLEGISKLSVAGMKLAEGIQRSKVAEAKLSAAQTKAGEEFGKDHPLSDVPPDSPEAFMLGAETGRGTAMSSIFKNSFETAYKIKLETDDGFGLDPAANTAFYQEELDRFVTDNQLGGISLEAFSRGLDQYGLEQGNAHKVTAVGNLKEQFLSDAGSVSSFLRQSLSAVVTDVAGLSDEQVVSSLYTFGKPEDFGPVLIQQMRDGMVDERLKPRVNEIQDILEAAHKMGPSTLSSVANSIVSDLIEEATNGDNPTVSLRALASLTTGTGKLIGRRDVQELLANSRKDIEKNIMRVGNTVELQLELYKMTEEDLSGLTPNEVTKREEAIKSHPFIQDSKKVSLIKTLRENYAEVRKAEAAELNLQKADAAFISGQSNSFIGYQEETGLSEGEARRRIEQKTIEKFTDEQGNTDWGEVLLRFSSMDVSKFPRLNDRLKLAAHLIKNNNISFDPQLVTEAVAIYEAASGSQTNVMDKLTLSTDDKELLKTASIWIKEKDIRDLPSKMPDLEVSTARTATQEEIKEAIDDEVSSWWKWGDNLERMPVHFASYAEDIYTFIATNNPHLDKDDILEKTGEYMVDKNIIAREGYPFQIPAGMDLDGVKLAEKELNDTFRLWLSTDETQYKAILKDVEKMSHEELLEAGYRGAPPRKHPTHRRDTGIESFKSAVQPFLQGVDTYKFDRQDFEKELAVRKFRSNHGGRPPLHTVYDVGVDDEVRFATMFNGTADPSYIVVDKDGRSIVGVDALFERSLNAETIKDMARKEDAVSKIRADAAVKRSDYELKNVIGFIPFNLRDSASTQR